MNQALQLLVRLLVIKMAQNFSRNALSAMLAKEVSAAVLANASNEGVLAAMSKLR